MKITITLLFVFVFGVHANGLAQRISLKMKSADIEKALNAISKQANMRLLYLDNLNANSKKIDLDLKNVSVEQALNKVLSNNNFEFKIIANTISVKRITKVADLNADAKQDPITGVVKDSDGVPLAGATVTVKGTSVNAYTDQNGKFKIDAPSNATLIVKYVGYVVQEISVSGKSTLTIVLQSSTRQLDGVDIVSTGYQKIDRKAFTGAAATVKAEDAERAGVQDISRMLEGQVAGVSIQNVSGTFGAAPKIRVRGATSLTGDNKPLWVIDGVILEDIVNISNDALSTGDLNTILGSSVAGLNPDDIESFTILKDAAATAMYGARAMNGVVVVNTKKGRQTDGKAKVNYSGNFTTYIKPKYADFDIMNSYDQMAVMIELRNKGYFQMPGVVNGATGGVFQKMYNEIYNYDPNTKTWGLRNDTESQVSFLTRYANANTDWFDLLFKNSFVQSHSVSFTNGSEKAQNYTSISYLDDPGMTVGNSVKRLTGNFRSNYKFGEKFSAEVLGNGNIRKQIAPGTANQSSNASTAAYTRDFDNNPYNYAQRTSRLITLYDEQGNLEYFTKNYAPYNILNEIENNFTDLSLIDFKIQGTLKYKIIPSLSYSVTGAYRFSKTENKTSIKENSNYSQSFRSMQNATVVGSNGNLYTDPANPGFPAVSVLPVGGFYNTVNNELNYTYFRQDLEYNKDFEGGHNLNLFANMELTSTDRLNESNTGVGYRFENGGLVTPDYRYFKQSAENDNPYFRMGNLATRYVGYSMRSAYSYKHKYLLNATIRYDGSNRMGSSRTARWLPTWNVSGKWMVDEEKFWIKNDFLSNLAIRATYGLVANLGNATNTAALFYNETSSRTALTDREVVIYNSNLANSELTWEKMNEFNLGFDFGLFKNNVNVTVDLYDRRSYDLIGSIATSGIDGESTKIANYADLKAKGIELAISGSPIKSGDFKWKTNFNFALMKNEVTRLDINPTIWSVVSSNGGAVLGYPQSGLFSLQFAGLDHNLGFPTFVGPTSGNAVNITLSSRDLSFLKYEGPAEPTFTGGFYNSFTYKNFNLSALFTISAGNKVRLAPTISATYTDMYVMTNAMLNRWIMPGDELKTNIPALLDEYSRGQVNGTSNANGATFPSNAYNYSTERVVDGDYIKLKQITLGYNLPKNFISRLSLSNASLSIVANNVLTLKAAKGLHGQDPEFLSSGGVALPVPRQISVSLKLGL